jgi:hypothetical protein
LQVAKITGNVTNSGGTLSPGTVPSIRSIGGILTENAGVLQLMIGGTNPGTDFDQLQVGGTTKLGGTLAVPLVNGFTPSVGQSFQVLTSVGNITGTFATLNLPALPAGEAWQVAYGTNDVTLNVVAAGGAAGVSVINNQSSSSQNSGHATGNLSVPEPATLEGLLAGGLSIGAYRLRRRVNVERVDHRRAPVFNWLASRMNSLSPFC